MAHFSIKWQGSRNLIVMVKTLDLKQYQKPKKNLHGLTATYISEYVSKLLYPHLSKFLAENFEVTKGLLLIEHTPDSTFGEKKLRCCSETMEHAALCNHKH